MEFIIFTPSSDDKTKGDGTGLGGVFVTYNDMRNTYQDSVKA
jgi:hypothetical protein